MHHAPGAFQRQRIPVSRSEGVMDDQHRVIRAHRRNRAAEGTADHFRPDRFQTQGVCGLTGEAHPPDPAPGPRHGQAARQLRRSGDGVGTHFAIFRLQRQWLPVSAREQIDGLTGPGVGQSPPRFFRSRAVVPVVAPGTCVADRHFRAAQTPVVGETGGGEARRLIFPDDPFAHALAGLPVF